LIRVLGIAGSLRARSYNRRLLLVAAAAMPSDVTFELFDGLAAVTPYDEDVDREPAHPAVERLRADIASADALLIATPEYSSSLPGHLKNALDWASRPFPDNVLRAKPAAVIGASTGLFGAVWAQAELRKVLAASGARVVDEELPVGQAHDAFATDATLVDDHLQSALEGIVAALLEVITPTQRTYQ